MKGGQIFEDNDLPKVDINITLSPDHDDIETDTIKKEGFFIIRDGGNTNLK